MGNYLEGTRRIWSLLNWILKVGRVTVYWINLDQCRKTCGCWENDSDIRVSQNARNGFLSEEMLSFLLYWDSNNEYSDVILQWSAICIKFLYFKVVWLSKSLSYKGIPLGSSIRIVNFDAKVIMREECNILTRKLFWTAILLKT